MAKKHPKEIEAKKEGSEMVTGIFNNLEVPGASLTFFYNDHNTPLKTYHMEDGQQYTIPLSVMEHLNNNTQYPIHNYKLDENQKHMMVIGKKVKRYFFEPLNMKGFYRLDNDIVTVERVPARPIQLSV